jgi:uncharacterized protein (TIGR03435 family)
MFLIILGTVRTIYPNIPGTYDAAPRNEGMKQFILFTTLACALVHTPDAFAQKFGVASIRVNRPGSAGGEGRTDESIASSPGSLTMKNVTLLSCIKWAWDMREFQISDGPGWLSFERYDIAAKAAGPAGDAELKAMLRSLLADRFELRVQETTKQLPVYALVVARTTAGLKSAVGGEPAGMRPGDGVLEFRNTSMPELAERLAKRPLSVDRPVVDKTNLTGGYDFSLKFAGSAAGLKSALEDIDRGTGQSLFTVLQEQLGLKLEPQRAALPVLVVEHAKESPGEN